RCRQKRGNWLPGWRDETGEFGARQTLQTNESTVKRSKSLGYGATSISLNYDQAHKTKTYSYSERREYVTGGLAACRRVRRAAYSVSVRREEGCNRASLKAERCRSYEGP
ncbi:hypothetical protein Dimus_018031, partial [Dionaea muscipula]